MKTTAKKTSKDNRCHCRPVKGKPNRYITGFFLMCAKCRKKIRKLTPEDHEQLAYITRPITEEESNAYGALLDKIKS